MGVGGGTGAASARLVALGAALALLAGCGTAPEPEPPPPVGTGVGSSPPPLPGTLSSGETFQLDSRDGARRVLVFYRAAQCGLCRVQLRQAQATLPAYHQQGVEVIGVTLDPPEVSRALGAELQLEFPLVSVDTATYRDWDALGDSGVPLPATYVLDEAGVIRHRHVGRDAADRMTDAGVLTILQQISQE